MDTRLMEANPTWFAKLLINIVEAQQKEITKLRKEQRMPAEKIIATWDEKKRDWTVDATRDIPVVTLSYNDIRMAIMALANQCDFLKQMGTFAHGNLGNDYMELARRIDQLLGKLEHYHKVQLVACDPRKVEEARKLERPNPEPITRVIQNDEEFERVGKEIKRLTSINPMQGSSLADRLKLLCVLVNFYEKEKKDKKKAKD